MAEFFQPNPQDPDAIRKAMLLKLFGGTSAQATPTAAPNAQGIPQASTAAQPQTPSAPSVFVSPDAAAQSSAQPAKPLNSARPSSTAPAGMTRVPSNGGALEPGNEPPSSVSPFPNEADWSKANPQPAHTPYVAPDLKHRMLMGLFAGMQEFGRPGEGAATVRDYLGDIRTRTDAEKNYPTTSAALQHQRYMGAVAGAKAPIDLDNLRAEIDDRYAQALERRARAAAALNPKAQLQHVVVTDPKTGEPISAAFDRASGKYISSETGEPIEGAKPWEKQQRPFNLDEQEFEARQALRTAKTPEEKAAAQARIEDIRASRQRPPEERSPKDSHLTPGQKATENRKYHKALEDVETERRARESGTYVHPHSGELMAPMTNDELLDRKQRAEDEYKDALQAAGDANVRRFNYRSGQYEGGEAPTKSQPAKPMAVADAGAKPDGKAVPVEHKVNDEVMYQGKRHKITAIKNGKATLQPLE